jgi:hypothetical protein
MNRSTSHDEELRHFENGEWREAERTTYSLPRVDGGKQAWLFLSACFMLEALVWGTTPPCQT